MFWQAAADLTLDEKYGILYPIKVSKVPAYLFSF